MATKQAMQPLQRSLCSRSTSTLSLTANLRTLNTRPITTLHKARAHVKPAVPRYVLQQSFRRSYADAIPPKTKRKGRSVLRWTWRVTYLSAIGGLVYIGYGIYVLRSPPEQLEPDPTKKNLVILGAFFCRILNLQPLTFSRNGLGCCLSSEETRYRELQRHRHLSSKLLPLYPLTTIMYYWHHRTQIYHGAYTKYPTA